MDDVDMKNKAENERSRRDDIRSHMIKKKWRQTRLKARSS